MPGERGEILVIGDLPADLRTALSSDFLLSDHSLKVLGVLRHCRSACRIPRHRDPGRARRAAGRDRGASRSTGWSCRSARDLTGSTNKRSPRAALRSLIPPTSSPRMSPTLRWASFMPRNDKIVAADRFVRSGAWPGARFPTTRRVSNRRVGIVGLGRIGRRIADKCTALGMRLAIIPGAASP